MAIIATSSKAIIDLSDGKSLSVYLGSNQPRTQIFDINENSYAPDWSVQNKSLVITPTIFEDQTPVSLSDNGISVIWKRKDGNGNETALISGESVVNKELVVDANVLGSSDSGMITYIAAVTYVHQDIGVTTNAIAEITYSLIKTGKNAVIKDLRIEGEQVFKYNNTTSSYFPESIKLTANETNCSVYKWYYKTSNGMWNEYPSNTDNISAQDNELYVHSTDQVFNNNIATIMAVTEDGLSDTFSIYIVTDGAKGDPGQPGQDGGSAPTVFLSNENITFSGDKDGKVAATTIVCNIISYIGTQKTEPTIDTIVGAPTGMNVSIGNAIDNEVPITISIENNATLGGSGERFGALNVIVTSPVETTLKITWSKVNTGATGEKGDTGSQGPTGPKGDNGDSAVVFNLYAPDGNVFVNGEGTLMIKTSAYEGTSIIDPDDPNTYVSYEWAKFESGDWTVIQEETGDSLEVSGSNVDGIATFQCTMLYKNVEYVDTITLTDKTDPFQAVIESSGGNIFKNTIGSSTLTCRLFQSGREIDSAGSFYTYRWYRLDQYGDRMDDGEIFDTGKSIDIDGNDVDIKTTFVCEVEVGAG